MAVLALGLALPASAQRHSNDWVVLGEQEVGFRVDRDTIRVAREGARFSQLRISAERNDVHLISLRLVYQNGYAEEFRVDREIRSGGDALPVDLRGERSYLKDIELVYRARPNFQGRAVVRVYGELHGGFRRDDRHADRDDRSSFTVIDTQRIARRDRAPVTFDVGRGDGRFSRLRLQARNGTVNVNDVRITFGNGETQRITINDRLDQDQMSRIIDLEGDRRFIRSVSVEAEPARGSRAADLVLLGKADDRRDDHARPHPGPGTHGPGNARRGDWFGKPVQGARDEWIVLDRNEANMFKSDTDSFEVGREMGTFRAIRVAVERQDVHFMGMTIHYGNGETEAVPLSGTIRKGTVSTAFDLRGRDRYIERITFKYRSKLSLKGSGRVEVQGLKHGAFRGR